MAETLLMSCLSSKAVLIMAILPLADCSRLLGIHPKTLHHWLKQANIPLAAHPTDARINCLTEEHVQQLASQHGRPLQLPCFFIVRLLPARG